MDQIRVQEYNIVEYFKGMTVVTNYGDTFRRYRVEGVDFDMTPESPFPDKKFKDYKEYFLKRYGAKIQVVN